MSNGEDFDDAFGTQPRPHKRTRSSDLFASNNTITLGNSGAFGEVGMFANNDDDFLRDAMETEQPMFDDASLGMTTIKQEQKRVSEDAMIIGPEQESGFADNFDDFNDDDFESAKSELASLALANAPIMITFPGANNEQESVMKSPNEGPILECQNKLHLIKDEMTKIKWNQREVIKAGPNQPAENFTKLSLRHKAMRQLLEQTNRALENIHRNFLLYSPEIERIHLFEREILFETRALDMFETELQIALGNNNSGNLTAACLVIVQQPFPKCVTYKKPLGSGVTVRLVCGPVTEQELFPSGPVVAEVIADNSGMPKPKSRGGAKAEPIVMQNDSKNLENGIAHFNELTFMTGTRKKTIRLKFKLQLHDAKSRIVQIESNASAPFVVETNAGIQWVDAEGALLQHEAFGNSTQITWYQFVNTLQRRYLIATKQDRMNPIRPLSAQDLSWLYHAKFVKNQTPGNQSTVSMRQFEDFWGWYGPMLHRIRYQRHLGPLWSRGDICGFVSRAEAHQVLENANPGTFLIRFSEQCAGAFAIAYVPIAGFDFFAQDPNENTNSRVRHYLMQPDDVSGAKKTLADFLGRTRTFTHLVQMLTHPLRGRIYQQVEKDSRLSEFYSKEKSTNDYGYDKTIA